MVGGDWEGEEGVKEDPPQNPQSQELVTRKPPDGILSPMTHRMEPSPRPPIRDSPPPPPPKPPPATKNTPAPKTKLPQKGGGMVQDCV